MKNNFRKLVFPWPFCWLGENTIPASLQINYSCAQLLFVDVKETNHHSSFPGTGYLSSICFLHKVSEIRDEHTAMGDKCLIQEESLSAVELILEVYQYFNVGFCRELSHLIVLHLFNLKWNVMLMTLLLIFSNFFFTYPKHILVMPLKTCTSARQCTTLHTNVKITLSCLAYYKTFILEKLFNQMSSYTLA